MTEPTNLESRKRRFLDSIEQARRSQLTLAEREELAASIKKDASTIWDGPDDAWADIGYRRR